MLIFSLARYNNLFLTITMITIIKIVNPLKMTKLVGFFTVFQLLMVLVIASSLESLRLGSRWVKRTKTGTSLLTLLKTWHEHSLSPSHIHREMPAFALAPCVCRRLVCSDGKKIQTQWACLMSALHTHTHTHRQREKEGEIPVGCVQQSAGQHSSAHGWRPYSLESVCIRVTGHSVVFSANE